MHAPSAHRTACSFYLSFALAVLGASVVACSGHASGSATGAAAAPLTDSCSGTFTCVEASEAGASSATSTTLQKTSDGSCAAGELVLSETDSSTAGRKEALQSDGTQIATWSGDSSKFDICTDDGCITCTNDADAAPSPEAGTSSGLVSSAKPGTCTGSTGCSSRGMSTCSELEGCYLDSDPVYFDGEISYYDYYCEGSTPSCSSHTSKDECVDQECQWQD